MTEQSMVTAILEKDVITIQELMINGYSISSFVKHIQKLTKDGHYEENAWFLLVCNSIVIDSSVLEDLALDALHHLCVYNSVLKTPFDLAQQNGHFPTWRILAYLMSNPNDDMQLKLSYSKTNPNYLCCLCYNNQLSYERKNLVIYQCGHTCHKQCRQQRHKWKNICPTCHNRSEIIIQS